MEFKTHWQIPLEFIDSEYTHIQWTLTKTEKQCLHLEKSQEIAGFAHQ
jgi:hypothetical protein